MTKNAVFTKKGKYFIRKVFRIFSKIIGIFIGYLWFGEKRIVHNRIIFETFQGTYTCNCKYIAEEIIRREQDCELIFIVNEEVYKHRKLYGIPEKIRLVKKESFENYIMLASSKVWIDNALNCMWKGMPKKRGQIYINTWHGSLGIKKISGDEKWRRIAEYGNKTIDYFVTNSDFEEKAFQETFWPDVKHLEYGHPRNDIFFDVQKIQECRVKVHKYFSIDFDKKIVLYAPTFRDNKVDVSFLKLNYKSLREVLKMRFGGEWIVLIKLHFHNANREIGQKFWRSITDSYQNEKSVICVEKYMDMQELMAAADVGITDYSSWIFDYLLLKRPAYIYAEDIAEYKNSRGFYYPITETPFPISESNDVLFKKIKEFDEDVFVRKANRFLKDKGCYEMGNASSRLVDFIHENI